MVGPVCNTTLEHAYIHEVPILYGMTFHKIALIVSALFATIATSVSGWLIFMHATHYSKPYIQRHIIRILFMVPIYSVVSFLSFLYYRHAVYFEVLMGLYEAFAIASFFTLLCHYVAPTLHEQKDFFRSVSPKPWVLPLNWFQRCTGGQNGFLRTPRSGLTWFNIIFLGVFQYCFIRVAMTITAVITQVLGRYCEASIHPAFAHVWTLVFEAGAVTVAMYCLIQFYIQLRTDLAHHRPFLKVLCIKLVIFFSFWQTLVISFLTSTHTLKPSDKINYSDIKIGFPSMLLCVEMAIFSIMHVFAFSYKEYRIGSTAFNEPAMTYRGGPLGWKAFADAYNPWDIVKAVGRSFRWLFVGSRKRHQDISYKQSRADQHSLEPTSTQTEYVGMTTKADFALGAVGGRKGRYQPLHDNEDNLPHHPVPVLADPEPNTVPSSRSVNVDSMSASGDLATSGAPLQYQAYSSHPDQLVASHPMPHSVSAPQQPWPAQRAYAESTNSQSYGSPSHGAVHMPGGQGNPWSS